MKIVIVSDTHGQHHNLELPEGDMLIHAGDCTGKGTVAEVENFLQWMDSLDYKHKVMIAGNHDFYFEKIANDSLSEPRYPNIQQVIPESVTYLNDSCVEIEGIKIWGSPIQPWFFDWAFNRKRGEDIRKHWDLIPNDIDILITHGPVYGVLDKCDNGDVVGCEDLLEKVKQIKPKIHICGHIHEAYGEQEEVDTHFINASVLDSRYRLVNNAVVLDYKN